MENIETLKDYIVIKHKEIKDLFFYNSTDAIFNIKLDKLISNMLIDEIKIRNKKGYRSEAYANDNKYIDFINSIINILMNEDNFKTFDSYSYQELMSVINDLKYDNKLIKKYDKKFKEIKEEFHANDHVVDKKSKYKAVEPGTNINSLYSTTHENDIEKIDIVSNDNLNKFKMNLQLLAAKETNINNLGIIYNENVEGHKEYQTEQFKLYNSNTLNFKKKKANDNMIEQYAKYFIHKNKRFMAVKPSKHGVYPSDYYEHVKKYNSFVDVDNKIILFLEDVSKDALYEMDNV